MKASNDLIEVAKVLESLTGAPPPPSLRQPMTRKEKRGQAERVRRFLALSPSLQKGVLRYGEHIRDAYK